jgi:2-polyprenyl-6-methoxyphenol hydroxylase-like FAD-dependent oxidoreductase
MSKSYSVVIQGGGPVGLACAAWLLQKNSGLALLLVDRNPADDAGIQAGDINVSVVDLSFIAKQGTAISLQQR